MAAPSVVFKFFASFDGTGAKAQPNRAYPPDHSENSGILHFNGISKVRETPLSYSFLMKLSPRVLSHTLTRFALPKLSGVWLLFLPLKFARSRKKMCEMWKFRFERSRNFREPQLGSFEDRWNSKLERSVILMRIENLYFEGLEGRRASAMTLAFPLKAKGNLKWLVIILWHHCHCNRWISRRRERTITTIARAEFNRGRIKVRHQLLLLLRTENPRAAIFSRGSSERSSYRTL